MTNKPINVTFDKATLDLISNLGIINPSIILEKDKSKKNLIITRANASRTIAYFFQAPIENFNFDGDEIAFYNFPEFHQMLSCFETPRIQQNINKLEIFQDKAKIHYVLSDSESIKRGPGAAKFTNPDAAVKLSSTELKELEKMVGLVNGEVVEFTVRDSEIGVLVRCSGHQNSFEKNYASETKNKNKFTLKIAAEIFTLLPKEDYLLEIKKEGIVKLSFVKNKTKLELFTGEVVED